MAAFQLLSFWPCNEATSGGAEPDVLDAVGSSDLPITYVSGTTHLEYTSDSEGAGLDSKTLDGNQGAIKADLSADATATALDGADEIGFFCVIDVDDAEANGQRVFSISTSGGNGEIALVLTNTVLLFRFGHESSAPSEARYDIGLEGTGKRILSFRIDSKEADAADRCVFKLDNVTQTPNTGGNVIAQNVQVQTQSASNGMALCNRYGGSRGMNGRMFAAGIGTGLWTAQEETDLYDALAADHDTNPFAGGDPVLTADSLGMEHATQAASLLAGREAAAATLAMQHSAQAATLLADRPLTAAVLAMQHAAQDASLNKGATLAADTHAIAHSAQDASLLVGGLISAESLTAVLRLNPAWAGLPWRGIGIQTGPGGALLVVGAGVAAQALQMQHAEDAAGLYADHALVASSLSLQHAAQSASLAVGSELDASSHAYEFALDAVLFAVEGAAAPDGWYVVVQFGDAPWLETQLGEAPWVPVALGSAPWLPVIVR